MTLEQLGWGPSFRDAFDRLADSTLRPARVASHDRTGYGLIAMEGEMFGTLCGRLRHRSATSSELPAVGDWVAAQLRPDDGTALIDEVLPRRSKFSRKVTGERTGEQILAANVDVAFLVAALGRDFNLRRLERYASLAWDSGASPAIVLTKADIAGDTDDARDQAKTAAPGVPVHVVSGRTGEGLDALRADLSGSRTGVLLGSSGAGKSTIINALVGYDRQAVATLGRSGKGRHATTRRELIPLPGGGLLIDTPGLREVQLWGTADGVDETFSDIEALAPHCRFRDCTHRQEPGCAVVAAAKRGDLDPQRLESFRKLQRELDHLERRQSQFARQEAARRTKMLSKSLRAHPKYRNR